MLAVVTEVLGHGAGRVGGKELQGGGIRGSGRDNDGVLEGAGLAKELDELCDGGPLLANGDVHAVDSLLAIHELVASLLVEDGIHGNGGLASLPVADDELTLTAADGDERVHSLDTSEERLTD